jgi:hypothetical protein
MLNGKGKGTPKFDNDVPFPWLPPKEREAAVEHLEQQQCIRKIIADTEPLAKSDAVHVDYLEQRGQLGVLCEADVYDLKCISDRAEQWLALIWAAAPHYRQQLEQAILDDPDAVWAFEQRRKRRANGDA